MYRRILVPLDATEVDRDILEHVKMLASYCQAEVVLLRAAQYDTRDARAAEVEEAQAALDAAERELGRAGVRVRSVVSHGDPAETICRTAEEMGCDLIAMSTHGHGPLLDLLLGSVADRVRHCTSLPVLLIRATHRG